MNADANLYEAEVVEGLEAFARDELAFRLREGHRVIDQRTGAIRFSYRGNLRTLSQLRSVQAVYSLRHYDIPRPKALLGDQHLRALLDQIGQVTRGNPRDFRTFFIAAAGSESSVMNRIKQTISERAGLEIADDKGDLMLRIRPGAGGWETLVRFSPRPLATRDWRVCNFEGALNGTVAYAMATLLTPEEGELCLNLASGSGSLLVEGASRHAPARWVGIDRDAEALACARDNLQAARGHATLIQGDLAALPLADASAAYACADLPFGQLSGSHRENIALYPAALREAARVVRPRGLFVIITHEVRLLESTLSQNIQWAAERTIRITLRGLHPRIYVLRRQPH